jgi:hypothetical protein
MMRLQKKLGALLVLVVGLAVFTLPGVSFAQQFAGDNQWVAPQGVATLVGTVGEDYSQAYLVAALLPDWEFNAQLTYYYDEPETRSDSYTALNLFAKHRFFESANGTTGYAAIAGTGVFPDRREQGEQAQAFDSWYLVGIGTYGFVDDQVLLDLLPGAVVNFDQGPSGDTAWGFSYTARLAVYGVVPSSALVAEVFGTAGEAFSEPSYRVGLRWEGVKWVIAGSYSDAFDGSGGAGLELGVLYFTDPRFCIGGC